MIVAFTGHRPKDLPPSLQTDYSSPKWREVMELIKSILKSHNELVHSGANFGACAISGMAQGFDTAAALAVISLRDEEHYPISLHLEIPCSGQEKYWSPEDQRLYRLILSKADTVHYITPPGHPFPGKHIFILRDKKMVDQADEIIALWNGKESGGTYQTVEYAKRKNKPITNIWTQIQ